MKRCSKLSLIFLVIACSPCLWAADAGRQDMWKPFEFLIGDWVGSGTGKPGEGVGEFSLAYELDKKILVRKNRNVIAGKADEKPSVTHEDLMIIYPQPGKASFRADYFDNEGHIIHYAVTVAEHKAVFESDEAAPGPKFRLRYELKPDGLLGLEFAIAAPGKGFQPYVTGTMKRK
jgi:hypothetical protein